MTNKNKILILGTIASSGTLFMIYNSWKKKILYDDIVNRIGIINYDLDKIELWDSNFIGKIMQSGRGYAELRQDRVKEVAEIIHEATNSFLANEDIIFATIQSIKSKVEIAQIKNFYLAKYNQSLKDDLKKSLNNSEERKLAELLNKKPDVIYLS